MGRLNAVKDRLTSLNQLHLLKFISDLSENQTDELLSEIESIDWDTIPDLIRNVVLQESHFQLPQGIQPPVWYAGDPQSSHQPYDTTYFRKIGEDLIRRKKVAVFCVAGGQGTRLGWDGPKGTYPATPIRHTSLFQLLAEQILHTGIKYNATVPLYIMTSPMNHGATVAYFNEHNYFGLSASDVHFFPQGVMPAFDIKTGKLLLADKGRLAFSPDGHGGSLKALSRSGALNDMREHGIEIISYIQIDNPLVRAVDPLFIGLHYAADDSSGEMSSKMLPKTGPFEKLGNFCRTADGRTTVIEYSDLPKDLAEERNGNNELRFKAGSIAVHCLSVEFVRRLTDSSSPVSLPWHRAEKKVTALNIDSGKIIEPNEPNAVKLEKFIFDALPLCESSIILETDRIEEFAPIKNASGVDSAESSQLLQIERHARWLNAQGVSIPRGENGQVNAKIEISPLIAVEPGDLIGTELPEKITRGMEFLIS